MLLAEEVAGCTERLIHVYQREAITIIAGIWRGTVVLIVILAVQISVLCVGELLLLLIERAYYRTYVAPSPLQGSLLWSDLAAGTRLVRSLAGFLLVNGDAKVFEASDRSPRERIADMMQRYVEVKSRSNEVLRLQKANLVLSLIVH